MNTNMTGSRFLPPCALGESSLSIGRVKRDQSILDTGRYLSLFV